MSFILDALRKSEHERQRSSAPSLAHVPLAAPRRHLPVWALVVMGLLAAAVLVLAGAWWQAQRPQPVAQVPPSAPVEARPATPPVPTATDVPAPRPTPAPVPRAALAEPEPAPAAAPLASAPADAIPPIDARQPDSLAGAGRVPQPPPVPKGPTVPSAAALLEQGIKVPALHLELHAYSDNPSERFVFINGRKYREGEHLPEGTQIVTVEPNGVVMSEQGHRFMLAPE